MSSRAKDVMNSFGSCDTQPTESFGNNTATIEPLNNAWRSVNQNTETSRDLVGKDWERSGENDTPSLSFHLQTKEAASVWSHHGLYTKQCVASSMEPITEHQTAQSSYENAYNVASETKHFTNECLTPWDSHEVAKLPVFSTKDNSHGILAPGTDEESVVQVSPTWDPLLRDVAPRAGFDNEPHGRDGVLIYRSAEWSSPRQTAGYLTHSFSADSETTIPSTSLATYSSPSAHVDSGGSSFLNTVKDRLGESKPKQYATELFDNDAESLNDITNGKRKRLKKTEQCGAIEPVATEKCAATKPFIARYYSRCGGPRLTFANMCTLCGGTLARQKEDVVYCTRFACLRGMHISCVLACCAHSPSRQTSNRLQATCRATRHVYRTDTELCGLCHLFIRERMCNRQQRPSSTDGSGQTADITAECLWHLRPNTSKTSEPLRTITTHMLRSLRIHIPTPKGVVVQAESYIWRVSAEAVKKRCKEQGLDGCSFRFSASGFFEARLAAISRFNELVQEFNSHGEPVLDPFCFPKPDPASWESECAAELRHVAAIQRRYNIPDALRDYEDLRNSDTATKDIPPWITRRASIDKKHLVFPPGPIPCVMEQAVNCNPTDLRAAVNGGGRRNLKKQQRLFSSLSTLAMNQHGASPPDACCNTSPAGLLTSSPYGSPPTPPMLMLARSSPRGSFFIDPAASPSTSNLAAAQPQDSSSFFFPAVRNANTSCVTPAMRHYSVFSGNSAAEASFNSPPPYVTPSTLSTAQDILIPTSSSATFPPFALSSGEMTTGRASQNSALYSRDSLLPQVEHTIPPTSPLLPWPAWRGNGQDMLSLAESPSAQLTPFVYTRSGGALPSSPSSSSSSLDALYLSQGALLSRPWTSVDEHGRPSTNNLCHQSIYSQRYNALFPGHTPPEFMTDSLQLTRSAGTITPSLATHSSLDDFRLHDTVPRGQEEPYSMLPSPTAALGTGLSSPLAHHALLPSKQQQYYRHPREKNGNPSIYDIPDVTTTEIRSNQAHTPSQFAVQRFSEDYFIQNAKEKEESRLATSRYCQIGSPAVPTPKTSLTPSDANSAFMLSERNRKENIKHGVGNNGSCVDIGHEGAASPGSAAVGDYLLAKSAEPASQTLLAHAITDRPKLLSEAPVLTLSCPPAPDFASPPTKAEQDKLTSSNDEVKTSGDWQSSSVGERCSRKRPCVPWASGTQPFCRENKRLGANSVEECLRHELFTTAPTVSPGAHLDSSFFDVNIFDQKVSTIQHDTTAEANTGVLNSRTDVLSSWPFQNNVYSTNPNNSTDEKFNNTFFLSPSVNKNTANSTASYVLPKTPQSPFSNAQPAKRLILRNHEMSKEGLLQGFDVKLPSTVSNPSPTSDFLENNFFDCWGAHHLYAWSAKSERAKSQKRDGCGRFLPQNPPTPLAYHHPVAVMEPLVGCLPSAVSSNSLRSSFPEPLTNNATSPSLALTCPQANVPAYDVMAQDNKVVEGNSLVSTLDSKRLACSVPLFAEPGASNRKSPEIEHCVTSWNGNNNASACAFSYCSLEEELSENLLLGSKPSHYNSTKLQNFSTSVGKFDEKEDVISTTESTPGLSHYPYSPLIREKETNSMLAAVSGLQSAFYCDEVLEKSDNPTASQSCHEYLNGATPLPFHLRFGKDQSKEAEFGAIQSPLPHKSRT